MPKTKQNDPLLTNDGIAIDHRGRYFCNHPTKPSEKEWLVVEKLPAPVNGQHPADGLIICRNERMVCRHVTPSTLFANPKGVAGELWAELGNVPVTQDGELEEAFLHFPKGTDREDVWQWFETTFDISVATLWAAA
ncbi:hypothetical protein [Marinobacter salicampi]|uniref:hypothetical protein n=1 Tax=Marinobacter salicampi TaxID=435907 RepID=UPI001A943633|nr:hypothetical protein [Marinobacter salicampi]